MNINTSMINTPFNLLLQKESAEAAYTDMYESLGNKMVIDMEGVGAVRIEDLTVEQIALEIEAMEMANYRGIMYSIFKTEQVNKNLQKKMMKI